MSVGLPAPRDRCGEERDGEYRLFDRVHRDPHHRTVAAEVGHVDAGRHLPVARLRGGLRSGERCVRNQVDHGRSAVGPDRGHARCSCRSCCGAQPAACAMADSSVVPAVAVGCGPGVFDRQPSAGACYRTVCRCRLLRFEPGS